MCGNLYNLFYGYVITMTEKEQQEIELQEQIDNIDLNIQETSLNPIIEGEMKKTLTSFFNEIDLVFDYIDKSIVDNLNNFLKSLDDSEQMKEFITNSLPILKKYEDEIFYIVTTKKKIRTNDFEFLNNIVLFNNLLEFKLFVSENKNTKRSIVKYLYNIYMSIFILNVGFVNDNNIDDFTQQLSSFVSSMQTRLTEQEKTEQEKIEQLKVVDTKNKIYKQRPNLPQTSVNLSQATPNFGGLLESLMQNGDIMNLATDLSKDIQNENLDPMMLLTSMMSGKPDGKIQQLVTNITSKIESKINNGELDKNLLEQQAKSILNTVQNTAGGNFGKMFENEMKKQ